VAVIALPTLAAACGPSRVTECNEVVGVVNGALKKLEESSAKVDADKAEKVAGLRSMATTMDGVASDLAKAKTTIVTLKDLSGKYQKLAKDVAAAARERSDAIDQNDVEKDTKARDALDKLTDQEGPLVNSINDFCKGS
jgi:phage-related protein